MPAQRSYFTSPSLRSEKSTASAPSSNNAELNAQIEKEMKQFKRAKVGRGML
jgi:hypothetical protein